MDSDSCIKINKWLPIGNFDLPEQLKRAYFASSCKKEILEAIECMFPSLQEELNVNNYVSRFHTLLYLEEMECLANIRKYNRERAHFTCEEKYLNLDIEHLSESRPSLIIGDRAEGENAERKYIGVIHEVLRNRILIRFDYNFQQRYNYVDCRLEFYFPRYEYHKQHYAISQVAENLGKQFLFPSQAQTRGYPQLDIKLNNEKNILLDNRQCRWYNCRLNFMQNKPLAYILRGEFRSMPYVIVGPPGTRKTATLIGTGARLLVGTPSTSSADVITTRLIENGVLKMGELIRLVSHKEIKKGLIPEHLMPYRDPVPAVVMCMTYLGRKLRHLSKSSQAQSERGTLVCEEALSYVRAVRSNACEYREMELFISETNEAARLAQELGYGITIFQGLTNFFLISLVLSTLFLGGHLMSTESMSLDALMAFLVAA
uniref:ABC transmembrane type-1 domain-containing protein n=1 Tax=Glossina palpalis gambiensis TaxID=67801 RepID=A0A1B0AWD0_9MUSC